PAAAAAAAILLLAACGRNDPSGAVLAALAAYGAGYDLAFGVLPLIAGRRFSLFGPSDVETWDDDADQ
ncbi:MAG TPA: hypothetical protein VJS92_01135, partial [Candidatus Polarisedimenticolaceae bacterium]|nr:hypothetical protein [Candidatus Polarisedimenticolaceae bacterium]